MIRADEPHLALKKLVYRRSGSLVVALRDENISQSGNRPQAQIVILPQIAPHIADNSFEQTARVFEFARL